MGYNGELRRLGAPTFRAGLNVWGSWQGLRAPNKRRIWGYNYQETESKYNDLLQHPEYKTQIGTFF